MPSPCSKCGGAGRIQVNETTMRQCICAYAADMRAHLGLLIASASVIPESPLFVPDGDDLTLENIHLKGYLPTILSHLKWAFTFKGLGFKFKVVTDQQILDVWLGKSSYTKQVEEQREIKDVYNTLEDLVGKESDLVIVLLGRLISPNRAMPAVLLEALMIRQTLNLPTWVIENTQMPFTLGHRSWNFEIDQFIKDYYVVVSLAGGSAPEAHPTPPVEDVSLDDVPTEAPVFAPRVVFRNKPQEASMFDYDDDLGLAGGGSGYKPNKRKWHK